MSRFQKEDSVSTIGTEDIETEISDFIQKESERTADEDVILESIDESDISSIQSLPDDLAKSHNYTSEIGTEFHTPKSTARTPRTLRTLSYTDDFEPDSVDPRGAVNEPQTARTVASTAYSSDFETSWQNENFKPEISPRSGVVKRKVLLDRHVSLDTTGRSYSTETFESETVSSDRTESSSDSDSGSVSVTRTSLSESLTSNEDTGRSGDKSFKTETDLSGASFQPDSEDERRFIDAKYDFFVKKLMLLEKKNRGEHVVQTPVVPELKESSRQKSFCQKKVELLRRKITQRESTDDREADYKAPQPLRRFNQIASDRMEDHGVPEAALHRLQMQNTMHNIKKAAKTNIHKPKNCRNCREKLAEATERSFLQQKLAVVSEKLLKDKILMQQNAVQEFADGLKDFPSHKDDPRKVYDRLMKTAHQKPTVAVQTVETRAPEHAVRQLKDYTESELKLENLDLAKEPTDQFWIKYFDPLKNCSWYPKS